MGATEVFYCENCNHVFQKDVQIIFDMCHTLIIDHFDMNGIFSYLSAKCPHCGNEHLAHHIDKPLASTIKLLNQKGYITLESCSGHTIDTIFDTVGEPYISLVLNRKMIDWWLEDGEAEKFTTDLTFEITPAVINIRPNMRVLSIGDKEEEVCVMKRYNELFYKLAKALPYLKKEEKGDE